MKKVILLIAFALVGLVLVAYLSGVRFVPNVILGRHIPFDKVAKTKCDFWKVSGGCYIGVDFFLFDNNSSASLRNDTLYIGGEPTAIIVAATKRYFAGDYELVFKRLSDGELSYYVSK